MEGEGGAGGLFPQLSQLNSGEGIYVCWCVCVSVYGGGGGLFPLMPYYTHSG